MSKVGEREELISDIRALGPYTGTDCVVCPAVAECGDLYDTESAFSGSNLHSLPCGVIPGKTLTAFQAGRQYKKDGSVVSVGIPAGRGLVGHTDQLGNHYRTFNVRAPRT